MKKVLDEVVYALTLTATGLLIGYSIATLETLRATVRAQNILLRGIRGSLLEAAQSREQTPTAAHTAPAHAAGEEVPE